MEQLSPILSEHGYICLGHGTEIKVNEGNTFIQIQPTGQNLTIE